MDKDFCINLPVNNLSFGNVSYNILKGIYKKGLNPNIFLIGNQVDLSSFKVEPDFAQWLQNNINSALVKHNRKNPSLKLWHLAGALESFSEKQSLLTFYECSNPTSVEINTIKNQEKVFVTSKYTKEVFESKGINNCVYVPLGFDSTNFYDTKRKYYQDDRISFFLGGKVESRKHTLKTLVAWIKKYGNQHGYFLNCLISNPFLNQDQFNAMLHQALNGQRYWNVNFLPFLKTSAEVNDVLNASDIILGMSGGEGFNLPTFNGIALGKLGVVLDAHVHKDFATNENSVLISPNGKTSCVDNMFFYANSPYNQGEFYTFDDDEFISGCEIAVKRVRKNRVNEVGKELQKWTYENTLDKILENI